MRLTTTAITIYNYYNDVWVRSVIQGALWHGKQITTAASDGLHTADSYTIRVPLSSTSGFLLPEEYEGEGWTARAGDIVIKGANTNEIERQSEIQHITNRFIITGFTDNRKGSKRMQHIRIDGK